MPSRRSLAAGLRRRAVGLVRRLSHTSPRLREAESALREGDPERALSLMAGLIETRPGDRALLGLRQRAFAALGDQVAVAATMAALSRAGRLNAVAVAERRLHGYLAETDPRWRLRVPGAPEPLEPASDRRVLHLLKESRPQRQSGYTMRSWYNVTTQRAAGWDPAVVTALGFPRWRNGASGSTVEDVEGIRHHRLDPGPAYPRDAPADLWLEDYAWRAADVVRSERPAIIHASSGWRGYDAVLVGLALGRHFDRPVVYEVRGLFDGPVVTDGQERQRRMRADTEVRVMRAADAVVTLAETMRADFIERGIPGDRIFVIPNGVDPDAFAPITPDPAIRARYGLGDRFVIGYISNLDHPREDHETLMAATARLAGQGRDVACLIVGDGTRRAELERFARDSGAADRIVFTGQVPHGEVPSLYAVIDAFVVPRRDERAARLVTPLKPFEAMSMERPLIVADLPALTEIAPDGVRSLAYVTEDAGSLAAAVARLIDEPALAARLAAAGRAWVVVERSWAANGPRWDAAYGSVLERRRVTA
jgi:glycosyltransferase involved in cell wall biosynthesis